jgi:hypothetical protein
LYVLVDYNTIRGHPLKADVKKQKLPPFPR